MEASGVTLRKVNKISTGLNFIAIVNLLLERIP